MSEIHFINSELISSFDPRVFRDQQPFPWVSFDKFLTEDGFRSLHRDFPAIRLFEMHKNLYRKYGQRPHNRYYLAYEKSIYHRDDNPTQGIVQHSELSQSWQRFLEELNGVDYKRFLQALLGVSDFQIRYAWHIGVAGSEVSPHRDAKDKIATHIFYFNTEDDWLVEWGGEILVLCGNRTRAMNPEFSDFDREIPMPFLNNSSFLFRNVPTAWHGVRAINPPEGKYRRVFNVILTWKPRTI
jgi:hypothetical protein